MEIFSSVTDEIKEYYYMRRFLKLPKCDDRICCLKDQTEVKETLYFRTEKEKNESNINQLISILFDHDRYSILIELVAFEENIFHNGHNAIMKFARELVTPFELYYEIIASSPIT